MEVANAEDRFSNIEVQMTINIIHVYTLIYKTSENELFTKKI